MNRAVLLLVVMGCTGDEPRTRTLWVPLPVPMPTPVPVEPPPDWRPCPLAAEPVRGQGLLLARVDLVDHCRAAGRDDLDLDGTFDAWEAVYREGRGGSGGSWQVSIEPGELDAPFEVTDAWDDGSGTALRRIHVPVEDERLAGGVARLLVDERRAPGEPSAVMRLAMADAAAPSDVIAELPGELWLRRPHSFPLRWERRRPRPPVPEYLLERAGDGGLDVVVLSPPSVPDEMETRCARWDVWVSTDAIVVKDRRRGRWAWLAVSSSPSVEWGGQSACAGDLVFVLRAPGHGNDVLVFDLAQQRAGVLDHIQQSWSVDASLRRFEWTQSDGEAHGTRIAEIARLMSPTRLP